MHFLTDSQGSLNINSKYHSKCESFNLKTENLTLNLCIFQGLGTTISFRLLEQTDTSHYLHSTTQSSHAYSRIAISICGIGGCTGGWMDGQSWYMNHGTIFALSNSDTSAFHHNKFNLKTSECLILSSTQEPKYSKEHKQRGGHSKAIWNIFTFLDSLMVKHLFVEYSHQWSG